MSHPQQPPAYLNTEEAAEYLSFSCKFLELMRGRGDGPKFSKFTRAVRYRREDLDSWMTAHVQRQEARDA